VRPVQIDHRTSPEGRCAGLAGVEHERNATFVRHADQLANDDSTVEGRRFSVRRRPTDEKWKKRILFARVFDLFGAVVETILNLHCSAALTSA
jgi:hypothetical protein